jgi:glycosyltransferase involved in cell wall biosynthesis
MGQEGAPLLSVVIPCLNVEDLLRYQLQALSQQQCSIPWEVIIVDNGSTDNTVDVALSFREHLPALKITSEQRRGRHYACNAGVTVARGQYIVFVDGDDEVKPGFLQAMTDALEHSSIVGGKLVHSNANGNGQVLFGRVQTDRLMQGFGFLPYASGSCLGIRKAIFEEAGGFHDKDYCEDADLSWRLQLAGYQIQFSPQASILYRQRSSLRQMFNQHRNYGQARALLYKDYRVHGMKRRSVPEAIVEWLRLLRSAPRLRSFDQKARWVRRLGKCYGQMKGSIKYKVFFP